VGKLALAARSFGTGQIDAVHPVAPLESN
jgi:hypothetical protein